MARRRAVTYNMSPREKNLAEAEEPGKGRRTKNSHDRLGNLDRECLIKASRC